MSNPAYLFLTDENGSPMVGPCLVSGREGAIELKSFTHNVNIPVDGNTGRLTGTRIHMPVMFQKEFDRVTPLLFRALSMGKTLQSATIKMYQINQAGLEQEYFNIFLENVKITSITPGLYPGANTGTHLETVLIRYEKITWKHCEGNIIYSDSWNERATY
ncbi:type VI secretion system tube protein TssD [Leclercia adecarboxylata]|jgi:type VI secretion system secreted protein Hcp|uniref:Hcp family type VI secretion system effector n=1 Tax=Leclercia TaxID=83654 RepID=UPI000CDBC46A|nr:MULTISPECIES: type VI secretion system tube protein TssD [Leclercia]POW67917.1 type VI secretion system tube protein Hcp [Leclercia sp. LSNIH4]AUY39351.1 type VI secretion system tube protein Hcp [Leclercia sp. LSNIH3]MDQ2130089.1 type VI secretion system tube protein TssD [Leclercia adecarboxylata]MDV7058346.1 type VI secretion system tube protein TssD [Leclercia adecarboxylata]QIG31223.1 type VI secretion system tube protein Hcp [Leclercia adecarboxylata]